MPQYLGLHKAVHSILRKQKSPNFFPSRVTTWVDSDFSIKNQDVIDFNINETVMPDAADNYY